MHCYHATTSKLLTLPVLARAVLLAMLMVGITPVALAQECLLQYAVTRNGAPMGLLQVRQTQKAGQVVYKLRSVLKTSFLFAVTVTAFEEAVYEKGVLTYARVYRKVNSSVRLHTQIQAAEKGYTVTNRTAVSFLKQYPITYNMLCLYTLEPQHKANVFSDALQQFIRVVKKGPHQYRITFPDGGFNDYYYRAGTCIKVVLNNTWFHAEMTLIQPQ